MTETVYIPVSRELLQATVSFLSEDLGCDHSVGICMCEIIGVVRELNLNLAGQRSCPNACEDGFVWDEATYERNAAEYRAKGYEPHDDCGSAPCPVCDGKGTVSI